MATLLLAGLLAGGGLYANKTRTESQQAADLASGLASNTATIAGTSSLLTRDDAQRRNISAVLNRQIPNQRALGQNIYAVDDYVGSDVDLQARSQKVYGPAIAKQEKSKQWAQPTLTALGDGDGAWVNYAGNPQQPNPSLDSFKVVPFVEEPYSKVASANRASLNTFNPARRFEEMTNIGTGGTGYRSKTEVLGVMNGGEDPVATNLIDNISMLNPTNSLATTFDGSHLANTGTTGGITDNNTVIKTYIPTKQNTIDNKSVNPGQKTFEFNRMSGGNGNRDFNAPALLPNQYQMNHRRNVEGTNYDQLQRSSGQFSSNVPQGYNSYESMATLPTTKSQGKKLDTQEGRFGNAVVAFGQQGNNMGSIANNQTILETDNHRQTLQYDPRQFTQINIPKPMGTDVRDNIFLDPTRKDDMLFSHTSSLSNNERTNASYLTRTEPMPVTGKQTLIRASQGNAIQHQMPQQSDYQNQQEDWRRDLHITNANGYQSQLHRTPGAFIPGDHTRQMPNQPRATNKQLNSQQIGQRGPIGGASNYVDASAPRGWKTTDRRQGYEFAAHQPIANMGYDVANVQLQQKEMNVDQHYRQSKLSEVPSATIFGATTLPSATAPAQSQLDSFQHAWQSTSKRRKQEI